MADETLYLAVSSARSDFLQDRLRRMSINEFNHSGKSSLSTLQTLPGLVPGAKRMK